MNQGLVYLKPCGASGRHAAFYAFEAGASRIPYRLPNTTSLSRVLAGRNTLFDRLWWSALRHDSRRLLPSLAVVRRYCRAGGDDYPRTDGCNGSCKLHSLSACSLLLARRYLRSDSVEPLGGALMTEVRGIRKRNPAGAAIAAVFVLIAVVVGIRTYSKAKPSTDDASIDVEVVHIAPLVGGRIIELPIHENDLVHICPLLPRTRLGHIKERQVQKAASDSTSRIPDTCLAAPKPYR